MRTHVVRLNCGVPRPSEAHVQNMSGSSSCSWGHSPIGNVIFSALDLLDQFCQWQFHLWVFLTTICVNGQTLFENILKHYRSAE